MSKFIDKTGWIMKEHGVPESRLTVLYRAPVLLLTCYLEINILLLDKL